MSDTKSQAFRIDPVVISGPSGGGKSTLLKLLLDKYPGSIAFSVSHTSRQPRPGEKDGRDYYFMNRERMQEMIRDNELIESTEFAGNIYGTSKSEIERIQRSGQIPVLDVDLAGVQSIKRIAERGELHARYLFIKPPSLPILESRLRARGTESEEKLRQRLASARVAMEYAEQKNAYDLVIVNDDLQTAFAALEGFLYEELNLIMKAKY